MWCACSLLAKSLKPRKPSHLDHLVQGLRPVAAPRRVFSIKSTLRHELRARRKQIDDTRRLSLDASINHFLAEFIAEQRPHTIAAFWPFDGEPDLRPALAKAAQQGTQLALPVVIQSPTGPSLLFRQWSETSKMKHNRYGIPEPLDSPEIPLADIDLLLMPLVGWDESGQRLGMGAGFYDRTLQPFKQSELPIRAGVAYQLQKSPRVPLELWDIRLHMLLSENGWISFTS